MYPHPDPAQEIRTRLWLWRWLWLGDQETFKLNSDYYFLVCRRSAKHLHASLYLPQSHDTTTTVYLCVSSGTGSYTAEFTPLDLDSSRRSNKILSGKYIPTYIHSSYMASPSLRYLFGGTFLCNNRSYFYLCIRDIPAL